MSARQMKRHPSKSGLMPIDTQATSSNAIRKKKKMEPNSSEDEERSFWTPKHLGDLKAYNRSASEAPAELFRKDLISAMKLADNEPLTSEDFWGISDQWKQEWERGVQVPVNPDSLPEPSVIKHKEYPKRNSDFRLTGRLTRVTHNDFFNNEKHVLSNLPAKAEKMCRYDMDNLDTCWLRSYNGERARMGAEPVPDHIFELIVENLEEMCCENIRNLLKEEEPCSIEFDEDVICDVCRSPDSEEGNEMVFCDMCNICVHQACYGITAIPSGSWLCRTCSLGIKPNCVLCPNKGGAMKSTKSGHKWAHVACALWIPEVSIGSVERMEPITKITNIPQSRWALVCVLCRERWGACIQCSVKSCKTAYHVTCAFRHGLEMKAIIEDENADDVKLRSYCEKHSRNSKKESSECESDGAASAIKKKKQITSEQKNQAKAAKLRQIEAAFYKYVDAMQTSTALDIDFETTETIFYYWKLKRRSVFNKPLITPRSPELELLTDNKEKDIECMKMFVQLRQYLERVRNLCYMVSRREKLSRTFFKTRETTFKTQSVILSNPSCGLKQQEFEAILHANHSASIYDHIYSHHTAPTFTTKEFDRMVSLIAGGGADAAAITAAADIGRMRPKSKPEKRRDINGIIKRRFSSSNFANHPDNPYRKAYLNGAEQRKSRSRSVSRYGSTENSSTEDSDSSLASTKWKPMETGKRISVFTSSEDDQLAGDSSHKSVNNNSKSRLFGIHPQKVDKSVDTSDDDRKKVIPLTARGRGGKGAVVKRGRGRPPLNRKPVKEKNLFSDDDSKPSKDLKSFDALMKTTTRSFLDSGGGGGKFEPKFSCYSSEEEPSPRKVFSPRAAKNKMKNSVPVAFSSSEDELPAKPAGTPRGRGRGRGRSRGSCATRPSPNTAVHEWLSSSSKVGGDKDSVGSGGGYKYSSDHHLTPVTTAAADEELAPATYKLTSDEEDKSDVSYRSAKRESDGFEEDLPGRPTKRVAAHSNSDNNEAALSGPDSSCLHLRTKGAVKEFTPKVESSTQVVAKKKQVGRPPKKPKSAMVDNVCPSSGGNSGDLPKGSRSAVSDAPDLPVDLNLFVPQRAAAKKASELITSQNNNPPMAAQGLLMPELEVSLDARKVPKSMKDSMSETESLSGQNNEDVASRISPQKVRKGKKDCGRLLKEDAVEQPKKNIFETPEILPYVPIREAARKAAENLKVGVKLNSLLPGSVPAEESELVTPQKPKKLAKPERPAIPVSSRTLRTKSPRSSSKGSVSAPSESDDELDVENSRVATSRKVSKEVATPLAKGSIFSESDEEPSPKKMAKEKTPPDAAAAKNLPNKNQLFRGDIYVFDHQSSSEDDDSHAPSGSSCGKSKESGYRRCPSGSPPGPQKRHSFRSSTRFTDSLLDNYEHEVENEEPTAETRRKAPDKKLKTSDGRPEHGFQPPAAEGEESGAVDLEDHHLPGAGKGRQSRLRQGGPECRQGVPAGDVAKADLRGHPYASPGAKGGRSGLRQQHAREAAAEGAAADADRCGGGARGKVPAEEPAKDSHAKPAPEKGFKSTFQCITVGQEEKTPIGGAVFNFTENEVQVKRLADIVEASDGEMEPKKVKIAADSDDDSPSSKEAKVEQPSDSGYKSAITTPEPNDNSASKAALSGASDVDSSTARKKAPVPQISPLDKSNSSKFLTSSRRKNLNDVIEERKKAAAEMSGTRTTSTDQISSMQRSSTESHYLESDTSEPLHEGNQSATESSGRSPSTSNFVEEWRTQWVKSPQPSQTDHSSDMRNQWVKSPPPLQMEHADRRSQWPKSPQHPMHLDHSQEPPQPYNSLQHHHPIPMPDYPPYMGMQQNIQDNFVYLSHLQMLQYHHYLSQQFQQTSKSQENPSDEGSDIVRMSHRDPEQSPTIPIHAIQSSKLSLVDDQLQRVKIPPQVRDVKVVHPSLQHAPEAASKSDARRPSDISYPIIVANSKAPDMLNADSSGSAQHSHSLSSSKTKSSSSKKKLPNYKHISQLDPAGSTIHKNVPAKSQPPSDSSSVNDTFEKPDFNLTADQFSSKTGVPPSSEIVEASQSSLNRKLEPIGSVLSGITIGGQSVVPTSTVTTVHSVSSSVTSVSPSRTSNVPRAASMDVTLCDPKSSPEIDVVSTNPSPTSVKVPTPTVVSPAPVVITKPSPRVATTSPKAIATVTTSEERSKVVSKSPYGFDDSCVNENHINEPHINEPRINDPRVNDPRINDPRANEPRINDPRINDPRVNEHRNNDPRVNERINDPHVNDPRVNDPRVNDPRVNDPRANNPRVNEPRINEPRVNDTPLVSVEVPTTKRVPIYRQEPKIPTTPEKYILPRSNNSASPRWNSGPKERKRTSKGSTRGRKPGRGAKSVSKRGRPSRYKVSVPKELVGTVYDFDQFDEFDDGASTATLGDLRNRRGHKRSSFDSTPQHSFASPDSFELKVSPATKRTREKKSKSGRDKSCKEGGISPLKINLPLSDPLSLEDCSKSSSKSNYMQERRKSTPSHSNKSAGDASSGLVATTIVTSYTDNGTNQLRLKIKGPYANAFNSSLPTVQPESSYVSAASVTSSATSNLRRMRKKELIQQYCNQDMNPEPADNPVSNPPAPRAGISIPKAIASMPHIPTREDYKKYTQDDPNSRLTSSGRRKKPRELKQLDWSLKEDCSGKRSSSESIVYPRKRARIAKENRIAEVKESTKIVISLGGKRSPEVVSKGVLEAKERARIRVKPPKKRLPEDIMLKVKSDGLKFREEIMKNFDDRVSAGGKGSSDEKRSKRRRIGASNEEKMDAEVDRRTADFDVQDVVKVVTDEGTNKIVLKISKTTTQKEGGSGSGTPNAHARIDHPLKIKLNLSGIPKVEPTTESYSPANNGSSPLSDKEPLKVQPLKLKLQRRAQGYVTSNCDVKVSTPPDHGPGPPKPTEPPDPSADQSTPHVARIEHRDRESVTRDHRHHQSIISDDVYQRLEAHLAATDGGVAEVPSNSPSISQPTFSSLKPVSTIKDNPGCR